MLIFASALAAIIPMFVYLILIWMFDKYDREPFGMVIKSYLWGAIGAIIFSVIFSGFVSAGFSFFLPDKNALNLVETIYIAPFIEESTKGLFLLILIRNKKFDNVTDGLVYGGAIGLGFGMTENFFYFIYFGNTIPEWFSVVIIRTLFSAVMHCVSTGILGAFIGYAKFKGFFFKVVSPLTGLLTAILIHFLWNYSVSFKSTAGAGFLFLFLTVLVFIGVYIFSILTEKKIIYNELLNEVETGLIPAEHLMILNSSLREKSGWVDERIRKLYINAATTLAFRKRQLKSCSSLQKDLYEKDVIYYREHVKNLLKNFT